MSGAKRTAVDQGGPSFKDCPFNLYNPAWVMYNTPPVWFKRNVIGTRRR